jgi:hypothetical protein
VERGHLINDAYRITPLEANEHEKQQQNCQVCSLDLEGFWFGHWSEKAYKGAIKRAMYCNMAVEWERGVFLKKIDKMSVNQGHNLIGDWLKHCLVWSPKIGQK